MYVSYPQPSHKPQLIFNFIKKTTHKFVKVNAKIAREEESLFASNTSWKGFSAKIQQNYTHQDTKEEGNGHIFIYFSIISRLDKIKTISRER